MVRLGLLNAPIEPLLQVLGFSLTALPLEHFLLIINAIIVKMPAYPTANFTVAEWLNTLPFSLSLEQFRRQCTAG